MNPLYESGLDRLVAENYACLRGLRVGLLANQASVDRCWRHAADLLHEAPGVQLVRLFGPEHGLRGEAQDMVGVASSVDERTGCPVVSLYGDDLTSLRPRPEDLDGLDVIVADLRDIGTRYYTFAATLFFLMDEAARSGVRVIVLDRPNPLGRRVQGPSIQDGYLSFVGAYPMPIRHGLTLGELARLYCAESNLKLELEVIPCHPVVSNPLEFLADPNWIPPSPNMPAWTTAAVYPGACLLEGTNLSEGRGTTRPFELWGSPWLAPHLDRMAHALRNEPVRLRPCCFQPTFHKFSRQNCYGLQPHAVDAEPISLRLYVGFIALARALEPDQFVWRTEPYEFVKHPCAFDLLAGSDELRLEIEAVPNDAVSNFTPWLDALEQSWQPAVTAFESRRSPYLLDSRPVA